MENFLARRLCWLNPEKAIILESKKFKTLKEAKAFCQQNVQGIKPGTFLRWSSGPYYAAWISDNHRGQYTIFREGYYGL